MPTKVKKASITKPVPSRKAAADFAEAKPKAKIEPVSGQIPDGDVRLTANIRIDLHLRLKIEAAKRRITIGELVEEMIEKNIPNI